MNHAELSERIQTVLDGLATPDEERELEQLLARDANARAEFVQWQRMFVALGRVPQASPPEGLVAAVTARLPTSPRADQLFEHADVIGYKHPGHRSPGAWFESTIGRHFRPGSPRESRIMSEQQQRSAIGNRKLWAGGAVAVLAVGVAMIAFDLPPKSGDVVGTIAPAERYRAPQDGAEAVKLGDQTVAQLMQNDTFDRVIKDPQMKALSQDAGIKVLAQVLSRSPDAARLMLANVDASRAASENVALAQAMLGNVEASRAELAAMQAGRQVVVNAQDAGRQAAAVDAGRQAAAVEAGRMQAVDAGRIQTNAQEANRMQAAAEANRMQAAAEAGRIQANAKDASRAAVETGRAQVDAKAVGRAELAAMMAGKLEASQAILSSVEASRAAVQNVAVAQAVVANAQAARMLLSADAGRIAVNAAEAGRMQQAAEASRAKLDRAAERAATGN